MTIRRTLAAALAATAFAAPAASAQPPDMHASVAMAAAEAQTTQDLRSPDARDAAHSPRDARTAPANPTTARRTWTWTGHRQAVLPAAVAEPTDRGKSVDWTTIGLGIAGVLLVVSLVALTAGIGGRTRATQRQRASA